MTREGFGAREDSLSTIVAYGLFSINFAFASCCGATKSICAAN
jgi:hypothetical protein